MNMTGHLKSRDDKISKHKIVWWKKWTPINRLCIYASELSILLRNISQSIGRYWDARGPSGEQNERERSGEALLWVPGWPVMPLRIKTNKLPSFYSHLGYVRILKAHGRQPVERGQCEGGGVSGGRASQQRGDGIAGAPRRQRPLLPGACAPYGQQAGNARLAH